MVTSTTSTAAWFAAKTGFPQRWPVTPRHNRADGGGGAIVAKSDINTRHCPVQCRFCHLIIGRVCEQHGFPPAIKLLCCERTDQTLRQDGVFANAWEKDIGCGHHCPLPRIWRFRKNANTSWTRRITVFATVLFRCKSPASAGAITGFDKVRDTDKLVAVQSGVVCVSYSYYSQKADTTS